ncbi:MAG: hypothetical protein QXD04_03300, partial [Candidatus Bathyarchaeia archaeon]
MGFRSSLTKAMPRWVGLALVAITMLMGVFTVSGAITNYTLIKPYVVGISTGESQLKIEGLDFNAYYNSQTNQWSQVKV